MAWGIALLVKPLALFVLMLGVRALSNSIASRMPAGRFKALLFRRID